MADSWAGALPLIRETIEREVYKALGYASHGAFISERFGDSLSKLGVEMRREVVKELTDAGLSTRSLAPVFGVSQKTIVKDRQAVEVIPEVSPDQPFDPTPTLPPREDDWTPGEDVNVVTGELIGSDDDLQTEPRTTGLDGKSYPQKSPARERRSALIDDARAAGWQVRKAIERLQRIQQDDRFSKNKVEILTALQPHLDFASEVISDLITTTELEN